MKRESKVDVKMLQKCTGSCAKTGRCLSKILGKKISSNEYDCNKVLIGYACDSDDIRTHETSEFRCIIKNNSMEVGYVHCTGNVVSCKTARSAVVIYVTSGAATLRVSGCKKTKISEGAAVSIPLGKEYELIPNKTTLFQYLEVRHHKA